MHDSIGTNERQRWAQDPYQSSESHTVPVAAVIEFGEYLTRRRVWSESPQCDKNTDEARNMECQQDAFNGGELFSQNGVDKERS